jgi:hypothetical protein
VALVAASCLAMALILDAQVCFCAAVPKNVHDLHRSLAMEM